MSKKLTKAQRVIQKHKEVMEDDDGGSVTQTASKMMKFKKDVDKYGGMLVRLVSENPDGTWQVKLNGATSGVTLDSVDLSDLEEV